MSRVPVEVFLARVLILASIVTISMVSSVATAANRGFRSIGFIFDEGSWSVFTKDKPEVIGEQAAIELQWPTQIIFLYNGWHLPGLGKDIRLADLEQHVFRTGLVFEDTWPRYSHPGYVAAVQTSSGDWALITEMGQRYIIEYGSRIGVVSRVAPNPMAKEPVSENRDAAERLNLAKLESTTVSVSSVNGKREQNNSYYGARNLIDGGSNVFDGINYTTWLSDHDAAHWIRLEFRGPVDIYSIMLESPSPLQRRPLEVAVDVAYGERDGPRRIDKLRSVPVAGFRTHYPLEKPLVGIVGLTLVFPGRSMVEVSEVEVMGRLR